MRRTALHLLSRGGSAAWNSRVSPLSSVGCAKPPTVPAKMRVSAPASLEGPLVVPEKTLMGPGPSNAHPRVLEAQKLPLLGHLHPEFCKIMDECKDGIRYMFQTENRVTLALSSTGHGGMEAVMCNMLEPGDTILIANNGIWGERSADMARRHGAVVHELKEPAGSAFFLQSIRAALDVYKPCLLFVTHGESSTGVVQNLEGIGDACKEHGCLFAVDTVASLGGTPFLADEWGVDVVYTGSQKVLGAPPGTAPISLSDAAWQKVVNRKTPIRSFYFDLTWLANYWGCDEGPRKYHHTGPISGVYALREALAVSCAAGLESLWERHSRCARRLFAGLAEIGLRPFVETESFRLPTVTTVSVPDGVNWKAVIGYCMNTYKVEIAGGLGPTAGKVWRVGLMGVNATEERVDLVLRALREALAQASI
ncbi:serine--pyruvate aminotransferase-like isoform X1 [Pollicipes pollicipes]|uniref:serine--pyruvate aminotransferase-like isoform X1 n=2 Tax=Pollicipes pollicipes TaxID=41117 RepID=UPI0018854D54|nr:serine--pyruvate aminotransferase-like isoform X1 [Pollicipes pollicipes]